MTELSSPPSVLILDPSHMWEGGKKKGAREGDTPNKSKERKIRPSPRVPGIPIEEKKGKKGKRTSPLPTRGRKRKKGKGESGSLPFPTIRSAPSLAP